MSILPDCTCTKQFGYVFGEYSTGCPRHGSTARWLQQKQEQREAALRNQRKQALTRPVHGGYPDAPHARPGREFYERLIDETMDAEDAAGGVPAAGAPGVGGRHVD